MIASHHRILEAAALVLVFVLGALAALGMDWLRLRRAACWTATAVVSFPVEWCQAAHGGPQALVSLTPRTAVEEAIAALRFGGRSTRLGDGDGADSGEPAQRGWNRLADRLRAAIRKTDGQRLEISFHHASPSADQTVSELNTIVGAYAARVQLAVASEMLRQIAGLGEADARVREELRAIGPEFDRLVDYAVKLAFYRSDSRNSNEKQHSLFLAADKESSLGKTKEPAVPRADKGPGITLEALHARREELLCDRTRAHPDVRYVEALIAEAERQLEEIPAPSPETAERLRPELHQPFVGVTLATSPAALGQSAPSSDASQWGELFRVIQALQARIETLLQTVQRDRQREAPARGSLLLGEKTIGIQWAEEAKIIGALVHPWALLWAAVAAGLVLAAGAGMVYTGARIDSPIESGDENELERLFSLPLVGCIEIPQTTAFPPDSRATRWKRPCLLAGAIVIAAYLAFLLQPFLI